MNNNIQSLTNNCWEKLFDKHRILQTIKSNGFFQISSNQINKFREARLMTKFDHRTNLPQLFKDNNLSILPITRGDYIISHFDAYHDFEFKASVLKTMTPPDWIQSLNYNNIFSEAVALNSAFAAGILSDFLEDENLTATVSGRMKSGSFDFLIKDSLTQKHRRIYIKNAQIEIDAAYEGFSSLALFEAKCNLADDFLIRQLYYPFRAWSTKITKNIRPIFFVYSNGIYQLYEYQFEDKNDYNSLCLIKQINYTTETTSITCEDIQQILTLTEKQEESKEIPLPQADKFERIINLCELLNDQKLTKENIANQYAFTPRQADYYTNAATYLGLLQKNSLEQKYELTPKAKKILTLPYKKRQLEYTECILKHKPFSMTLAHYFKTGEIPEKNIIVQYIKKSNSHCSERNSTQYRRASTIISWIKWIVGLINE